MKNNIDFDNFINYCNDKGLTWYENDKPITIIKRITLRSVSYCCYYEDYRRIGYFYRVSYGIWRASYADRSYIFYLETTTAKSALDALLERK